MVASATSGGGAAARGTVELVRTASKLREMADEIDRMAGVAGPGEALVISAEVIDLGDVLFRAYARRALRIRQTLGDFFAPGLFADPARDILLDLFAADEEGEPADMARCTAISGVPASTAQRWINRLHQEGLVEIDRDEADARRTRVRLSPSGHAAMRAYLAAAYAIPLGPHGAPPAA